MTTPFRGGFFSIKEDIEYPDLAIKFYDIIDGDYFSYRFDGYFRDPSTYMKSRGLSYGGHSVLDPFAYNQLCKIYKLNKNKQKLILDVSNCLVHLGYVKVENNSSVNPKALMDLKRFVACPELVELVSVNKYDAYFERFEKSKIKNSMRVFVNSNILAKDAEITDIFQNNIHQMMNFDNLAANRLIDINSINLIDIYMRECKVKRLNNG